MYRFLTIIAGLGFAAALIAAPARGEEATARIDEANSTGPSDSDLARASQNPVADLISLPFQNNTSFKIGPHDRTQNVLNIQPVIPVSLSEDWNLITRTIATVIYQPFAAQSSGGMFGLGDISTTLFLSPANSGGLIWGAGPILSFPTGGIWSPPRSSPPTGRPIVPSAGLFRSAAAGGKSLPSADSPSTPGCRLIIM